MAKIGQVTETPDELFDKAERDLMSIAILTNDTVYPPDRKYDIICFHATQAVEKFLKGYILYNGRQVQKIHDLEVLLNGAIKIDNSFRSIENECAELNQYAAGIKYTNRSPITTPDINKALKCLRKISDFVPIKTLRNAMSKEQKYKIITEITAGAKKPSNVIKRDSSDYDIDR